MLTIGYLTLLSLLFVMGGSNIQTKLIGLVGVVIACIGVLA